MRKGKEGIDDGGLIADLIQICLVDEIDHQTLFGAVAEAASDHTANFIHKIRLALVLLVMLEDQLKNVIKVDLLRLKQVDLKHHIIPVDGGFLLRFCRLLAALPIAYVVVT